MGDSISTERENVKSGRQKNHKTTRILFVKERREKQNVHKLALENDIETSVVIVKVRMKTVKTEVGDWV